MNKGSQHSPLAIFSFKEEEDMVWLYWSKSDRFSLANRFLRETKYSSWVTRWNWNRKIGGIVEFMNGRIEEEALLSKQLERWGACWLLGNSEEVLFD